MNNASEKMADLKHKIFLEMTAYWINVLYLTLVFAASTSYRRVILAHYYISYENWGISLIKALVLSKVIVIGGVFHFARRFENRSLILPTLFIAYLWVGGRSVASRL